MIRNLTRETIVSKKARLAKSIPDKYLGMILAKNSQGLIFSTRFGIHTFFMKASIDVLVLDYEKKVVKIREDLKPNRIFLWNPKFDCIVELPTGLISKSKTKEGDKLTILL